MPRLIAFILIVMLNSCSQKPQNRSDAIEFVIEDAQSYRYDLARETYTVFNMFGDTVIPFQLTNEERKLISDKYYDLQLDQLNTKEKIEDNCRIMPKFYTRLRVTKTRHQEIIIDDGCNDYKGVFSTAGKRVSAFLQFAIDILKRKPEIKGAPKSNIIYM